MSNRSPSSHCHLRFLLINCAWPRSCHLCRRSPAWPSSPWPSALGLPRDSPTPRTRHAQRTSRASKERARQNALWPNTRPPTSFSHPLPNSCGENPSEEASSLKQPCSTRPRCLGSTIMSCRCASRSLAEQHHQLTIPHCLSRATGHSATNTPGCDETPVVTLPASALSSLPAQKSISWTAAAAMSSNMSLEQIQSNFISFQFWNENLWEVVPTSKKNIEQRNSSLITKESDELQPQPG